MPRRRPGRGRPRCFGGWERGKAGAGAPVQFPVVPAFQELAFSDQTQEVTPVPMGDALRTQDSAIFSLLTCEFG